MSLNIRIFFTVYRILLPTLVVADAWVEWLISGLFVSLSALQKKNDLNHNTELSTRVG